MKSIKTLQCLNLKKMWICCSCAKLVQINFDVDWSGIKKFEILDWINEIQTNDHKLQYSSVKNETISKILWGRQANSDFQSVCHDNTWQVQVIC